MIKSNSGWFLRIAGGKWFLNTRYLLLSTPLIISLSLLSAGATRQVDFKSDAESAAFFAKLLLANICAISVCAAIVIFCAKTIFSNRHTKPLSLFVVVSFSSLVGAIKGASTGVVVWLFQLEIDLAFSIVSRIWQTSILGLWLIPALALLAHRLEQLQIQRAALVAERVNTLLQEADLNSESKTKDALREFTYVARQRLAQNKDPDEGSSQRRIYASAIRNLVAEELRPLSHRIWSQESRRLSSFSLADMSRRAINNFSTGSLMVSFVYATTSIPAIAKFSSLNQALARSLVSGVAIYLILKLASFLRPKKYALSAVWFLLVTLIATATGFFAGELIFGHLSSFRALESILATWLWLAQLAFLSSFLLDLKSGQKSLDLELTSEIGLASIDRAARFSRARIQNRDFANFLHGQIQNRLLGIALNLEKNQTSSDDIKDALKAVDEVLDSVESEFDTLNSGNLSEGIERQHRQWQGFVDIQSEIDPETSSLPLRDRIFILQVIDEAIANSVRHGLCKAIRLQVKIRDGRPSIELIDDGLGPRDGKPGLGTSFFKNVSNGNWSLEQQPSGGSKLTVNF